MHFFFLFMHAFSSLPMPFWHPSASLSSDSEHHEQDVDEVLVEQRIVSRQGEEHEESSSDEEDVEEQMIERKVVSYHGEDYEDEHFDDGEVGHFSPPILQEHEPYSPQEVTSPSSFTSSQTPSLLSPMSPDHTVLSPEHFVATQPGVDQRPEPILSPPPEDIFMSPPPHSVQSPRPILSPRYSVQSPVSDHESMGFSQEEPGFRVVPVLSPQSTLSQESGTAIPGPPPPSSVEYPSSLTSPPGTFPRGENPPPGVMSGFSTAERTGTLASSGAASFEYYPQQPQTDPLSPDLPSITSSTLSPISHERGFSYPVPEQTISPATQSDEESDHGYQYEPEEMRPRADSSSVHQKSPGPLEQHSPQTHSQLGLPYPIEPAPKPPTVNPIPAAPASHQVLVGVTYPPQPKSKSKRRSEGPGDFWCTDEESALGRISSGSY